MKVLLTGAAGNIGLETLKSLIDRNHDVTVLELDNSKNRRKLNPFKETVNIVYGSITDKELVNRLVNDKNAVIHLAAIIPPLADKKPELAKQVNFYGTLNIVEAIKKQKNKPFLIYSSSISVYGDRVENCYIKVGDPLKPSQGDYYAATKIATEKLIQKAGIPYTIFRLTAIMQGHPKTDPLLFHMPLDTKIEITSNIDAGEAFAKAIEYKNELEGKIFNLGGGEKCRTTYRDFLRNMFKIYGLNIHYLKEMAFATKNFHCGYYQDADKLNDILHFQNDTLETYYDRVKRKTNKFLRFLSIIFSLPIIYFLQQKSEPLEARRKKDKRLLSRFFK
jgi:nucleoside-diphosphate-sugar epimerase